jgi:hypothetical protein
VGRYKLLELVEEAQVMVDEEINHETFGEDNDYEEFKNMEIWEDELSMVVLNGNRFLTKCGKKEKSRVNKHILHYY